MLDSAPLNIIQKNQNLIFQVVDFGKDPRHAIAILFASVVTLSLIIFGTLVISQNIAVQTKLEKRDLAEQNSLQTQQKQEQNVTLNNKVSQDRQRKNDLYTIKQALDSFKNKNSLYPQSIDALIPEFLAVFPKDPETGNGYFYQAQIGQKNFEIKTILSSGEDYTVTGD